MEPQVMVYRLKASLIHGGEDRPDRTHQVMKHLLDNGAKVNLLTKDQRLAAFLL